MLRRLFSCIALASLLAGCAQLQNMKNALDVAAGASVPPSAVIVSGYTVDALEVTAANYLSRPRCPRAIICRNPAATAQIKKAALSLRAARDSLEQFLNDHPGQLGPSGLYDALQAAGATLKQVLVNYGIPISSGASS